MSGAYSTTFSSMGSNGKETKKDSAAKKERRRRQRAKITAQVHVRNGASSAEKQEEICMSVDVSRDGLLFTSERNTYQVGQSLKIIFPYSSAAASLSKAQEAQVVRATQLPDGRFGIAVAFLQERAEAPTGGASANAAAAASAVGAPVLLAIEPDTKTADQIRTMFQADGYSVVVVPNAQGALDVLRNTTPVVFIAEVEAEDMSGHDLCLIIKRNERLAKVPVILLTRGAQPADYSASHSLGAVVCMAKPFKPERLQHVVRLVAPLPANARSHYGSTRMSSSILERNLS